MIISLYGVPPTRGPVDGYSYAGLKIATALESMGHEVPWRDDDAPVSISFCQPDWYSTAPNQFRIGYTPWESTKVPDWWVPIMNSMDVIWTTSAFCERVFRDNGVERPILVVPHGIDTHEFGCAERKRDRPFYFLHIGEPAFRKGGQLVVDSFLEAFGDDEDVRLIVKANGYATCRLREPFGPVDRHPRITLFTDTYSVHELNHLYLRCHALVYPSNGEGFGLIPFQAIATGMPTAAVVWGGIREFGEHCIPISYTIGPSEHDYHLGDWAFPDPEDVVRVMRSIYEGYEDLAKRAFESAQVVRSMTWERVISRAIDETFKKSSFGMSPGIR